MCFVIKNALWNNKTFNEQWNNSGAKKKKWTITLNDLHNIIVIAGTYIIICTYLRVTYSWVCNMYIITVGTPDDVSCFLDVLDVICFIFFFYYFRSTLLIFYFTNFTPSFRDKNVWLTVKIIAIYSWPTNGRRIWSLLHSLQSGRGKRSETPREISFTKVLNQTHTKVYMIWFAIVWKVESVEWKGGVCLGGGEVYIVRENFMQKKK